MQKNSQEQGTVVKGQRAKVYSGEVRDKRFGDECGRRVQHLWRGGGADCTVEVYVSEESEEGVTVLRQRRQLQ